MDQIPAYCRPMQIVHNFRVLAGKSGDMAMGLLALKAQGIGGIVTNVPFARYLADESAWEELRACLRACHDLGLRVWLYDEEGYPSGSAGGHVLANRPDLEATGLYYDAENGRLFADRSYEGTHNCNNFHAMRRTMNLLEPEAGAEFLRVTHEQYARRLGPEFALVEAFFTDEPALNTLPMPELQPVRPVPAPDPPNPNRRLFPAVPWSREMAQRYRGTDLLPLFQDTEASPSLRRRFYSDLADGVAEHYFGQIQNWCRRHDVLSSGHLLREESTASHTPLYGNLLRCMMRLDIPGIDVLSANPLGSWRGDAVAAVFAASAAMLNGTRRLMSEASDFVQRLFENRLPGPDEITAALAWQAALGITDFTYYFQWGLCPELDVSTMSDKPEFRRQPGDYRRINDAIAALVARLGSARLAPDVFLYYPVELLQAAFYPQEKPWPSVETPPELARVSNAFRAAFRGLLDAGIIPCLVDGAMLRRAECRGESVRILGATARAIVTPEGCEPPEDCRPLSGAAMLPMCRELPRILFDTGKARILKDNPEVAAGILERDSGPLVLLVNLTDKLQTCRVRTLPGEVSVELPPFAVQELAGQPTG